MTIQMRKIPANFSFRFTWPLVVLAVFSLAVAFAAEEPQMPDGFRRWVHVGTGVIMPGTSPQLASEEGMHHIFANEKAVDAYVSGNFPDGSMVVYELREPKQTSGVIVEGDPKRLDVMIKDSAHYASTGGWRFERFWPKEPGKNAVQDGGVSCFQCHSKASAHGFVFSRLK
jgi:hypothetical protein